MVIAVADCIWGLWGAALLPESLRRAWADETIPELIVNEFNLAPGSGFKDLDRFVWMGAKAPSISDVTRNLLLNFVDSRRAEIHSLKVLYRTRPPFLSMSSLPFSNQTRDSLVSAGFLKDTDQQSNVTLKELLNFTVVGGMPMNLAQLPKAKPTQFLDYLIAGVPLQDSKNLAKITYGQLMDSSSMSTTSVLEFACMADFAVEIAEAMWGGSGD